MNKLFILNGIPVGVFIPVLILCLACGCFVGFLILRYTFKKSGKDANKIIKVLTEFFSNNL